MHKLLEFNCEANKKHIYTIPMADFVQSSSDPLPLNWVQFPNGKGYNNNKNKDRCQRDWRFPLCDILDNLFIGIKLMVG